MNEDNNEAGVWTCGSLQERELFGEGPNNNFGNLWYVFPQVCTEESMCSWCSMKEATKAHVCRNPQLPDDLFSSRPAEEKKWPCCKYCEMGEEEWESYKQMKLLEREDRRQKMQKSNLSDGILLLEGLKHSGLDAHNKSIDLCIASLTDIFNSDEPNYHNAIDSTRLNGFHFSPAIFAYFPIRVGETTREHHKKDGETRIEIRFRGKESGIIYRVELIYAQNRASRLASRIDEVLDANSSYPVSDGVLRGFIKATDFLKFQVCREDNADGWDYLCIDPGADFGLWPGDSVATLLMCLHDDLNTALEPAMYTLRGGLEEASKMAFLKRKSKLSLHRLMAYEVAYKSIREATSSMPADDVHALVSRIKQKFSDPDYARDGPPAEIDYGLLQEEAWEADWNDY